MMRTARSSQNVPQDAPRREIGGVWGDSKDIVDSSTQERRLTLTPIHTERSIEDVENSIKITDVGPHSEMLPPMK